MDFEIIDFASFPLTLGDGMATNMCKNNHVVLIGDAAHSINPAWQAQGG